MSSAFATAATADKSYRVRPATLDDADALVHHRLGMFTDMGTVFDAPEVERAFRQWLAEMMPAGVYRAWLVEEEAQVVAGGGITVLPWPPGPFFVGGRIAFVYNVYTEHAHRRRGLARLLMDTIHTWCRDHGIRVVGLHASDDGRPLYEALGYKPAAAPIMFIGLD
jgi:GNAT superfamily N-acetyltransferase